MRPSIAALCLSLCLLFSLPASGQQSAVSSEQRDPAAVAILQKSVLSQGGAAIAQIYDASVQGNIQILSGSPQQNASFLWKDAWSSGTPAYRREFHQGASTGILVSGNGQPINSLDGVAKKVPTYVSYSCAAFHIPAVLLATELNGSAHWSLRFVESTILNGQSAVHVRAFVNAHPLISKLSTQDWYLDPTSGLPLRVEYRVVSANDITSYQTVAMEFANFQPVSGVLIPVVLTEYSLDGEKDVVTVTSVALNTGLSLGDFILSTGGAL